eukprot:g16647.t1
MLGSQQVGGCGSGSSSSAVAGPAGRGALRLPHPGGAHIKNSGTQLLEWIPQDVPDREYRGARDVSGVCGYALFKDEEEAKGGTTYERVCLPLWARQPFDFKWIQTAGPCLNGRPFEFSVVVGGEVRTLVVKTVTDPAGAFGRMGGDDTRRYITEIDWLAAGARAKTAWIVPVVHDQLPKRVYVATEKRHSVELLLVTACNEQAPSKLLHILKALIEGTEALREVLTAPPETAGHLEGFVMIRDFKTSNVLAELDTEGNIVGVCHTDLAAWKRVHVRNKRDDLSSGQRLTLGGEVGTSTHQGPEVHHGAMASSAAHWSRWSDAFALGRILANAIYSFMLVYYARGTKDGGGKSNRGFSSSAPGCAVFKL